ncbi:hypothetical protein DSO57_1013752 [Entomophthora muscae]|uniref:Uncharacterized protein n=1 Tax=Entomophthora muscae TaxID=34485 RepID=A0ACC2RKA2_9FUNG|nr:hypothetical protein DSO57_1013752 [Entomophthora muscae]
MSLPINSAPRHRMASNNYFNRDSLSEENAPLVDSADDSSQTPEDRLLVSDAIIASGETFSWKNFWRFTGPGWLMSIAYLDPGNLESNLQAAAICGNKLLWILFWAHFLGLLIQNLSSRLGAVTGKHLAQHIRQRYPAPIATVLWLMCELAIIGSDIQEVVGTAVAFQILLNFPLWLGVLLTALDTFTFLALHRFGMRRLEAFFIALISIMALCFWFEMFLVRPDPMLVLEGLLIPTVPAQATVQAVAMVGAIIMPHNIFLHSALVAERDICRAETSQSEVKLANRYFLIESAIALFVSFLINLSILVVFAQAFYYPSGVPQDGKGLNDAAGALTKLLGSKGKYLWAIGLLAAGQSSTMTGTLAGQYVVEGFWKLSIAPWKRVLITRSLALIPSILVALIAQNHLDSLGEYLNALQSLQLPFALIPLLALVGDPKVMGRGFATRRVTLYLYYAVAFVLIGFNVYLMKHIFVAFSEKMVSQVFMILGGIVYTVFLMLVIKTS